MVPPEETSAIVPGLDEGKDYEFRVVPVNAAGPGDASDPTASIFTKARKGLRCMITCNDTIQFFSMHVVCLR